MRIILVRTVKFLRKFGGRRYFSQRRYNRNNRNNKTLKRGVSLKLLHKRWFSSSSGTDTATSLLKSSRSPVEFVGNILKCQHDPVLFEQYKQHVPEMYTKNAEVRFSATTVCVGIDQIAAFYNSMGGTSGTVYNSFMMDPIVEYNAESNLSNVVITSNVCQKTKVDNGCDYTYPLFINLQLLSVGDEYRVNLLHYNLPPYMQREQPKVLENGDFEVERRENSPNNSENNLVNELYNIWNCFRITNNNFGNLFSNYYDDNAKLIINWEEINGKDNIINFLNNNNYFYGGYQFFPILMNVNGDYVTLHLRGTIMSSDRKKSYNDNLGVVIEYQLNESLDKIIYNNIHFDTQQLSKMRQEFQQ